MEQILKDYKPDLSPTDKLELVKKIMPLIEEIPNNIVQNEYIKLISDRINIDETALIREVNKSNRFKTVENKEFLPIVTKTSNISEKAQKNLLSLFLTGVNNSNLNYLLESVKSVKFSNKNLIIIKNAIDKIVCEVNNDVDVMTRALYAQFAEDNELKDLITDMIYMADSFKGLSENDFKIAVTENTAKIQQYDMACERNEIVSKYKKLNDDDVEALKSQIELLQIIKNKQKIGD